jgi:hypothetical protein
MWLHLAFLAALLAGAAALRQAQQTDTPQYLLLEDTNFGRMQDKVNGLASSGYRIRSVNGSYVLLEKAADPPETYRYIWISSEYEYSPAKMQNSVNEAGAKGYRLLTAGSWIMEKPPHPHNYQYLIWTGLVRSKKLTALLTPAAGCSLFDFSGRSSVTAIAECPGELAARPRWPDLNAPVGPDAHRYVIVNLEEDDLRKFAGRGYRVRSVQRWPRPGVLMESSSPSGNLDYRVFNVKGREETENRLNKQGAEHFQVFPASLNSGRQIMERAAGSRRLWAYRVLEVKDEASANEEIGRASTERYYPIGVVYHAGWTLTKLLILEQEKTAEN